MQKKRLLIISLLIAFLLLQIGLTAKSTSEIQQLPKGVSIHQLDNGIKVLLIENFYGEKISI